MRRIFSCVAFMAAVALLAGCEWENSDGSSSSWSDSYSWINFAGVYRMTSVGVTTTATTTGQDRSETIGTGDNNSLTFTATLSNIPIIAGSVTVSSGLQSYEDTAADGNLTSGSWTGGGTVDYASGVISVTFQAPPSTGVGITVSYRSASTGGAPGISSLTITQTGNRLEAIDSNGVTYTGVINSLAQGGGDRTGKTSGLVVANFTLTASNGGQIVGTLTGNYTAPATGEGEDAVVGATGSLADRTIDGTFVASDGTTGDVHGTAGTVTTTTADTTTTN
jgi:hypothetical protein